MQSMKVECPESLENEFMEIPSLNYNVTPLMETLMYEKAAMKKYSFESNKTLATKWAKYKMDPENINNKKPPAQFPYNKDFHFFNYVLKYLPLLTIDRQTNFRMNMKPGPEVDVYGEIPTPHDKKARKAIVLTMKPTAAGKRKADVIKKKAIKRR